MLNNILEEEVRCT